MTVEKGLIESMASYPKGVFFMLGNEVCERFTYHGLRAILTLYLITELGFQESDAYLSYHLYLSLAYFAPLLGSIAADNYFGRFQVILKVRLLRKCENICLI
jgi:dipeptide/tripeptide permease